jgi:hypothetical protein
MVAENWNEYIYIAWTVNDRVVFHQVDDKVAKLSNSMFMQLAFRMAQPRLDAFGIFFFAVPVCGRHCLGQSIGN